MRRALRNWGWGERQAGCLGHPSDEACSAILTFLTLSQMAVTRYQDSHIGAEPLGIRFPSMVGPVVVESHREQAPLGAKVVVEAANGPWRLARRHRRVVGINFDAQQCSGLSPLDELTLVEEFAYYPRTLVLF